MGDQTLEYNWLIWRILKLAAAILRVLFIGGVTKHFPENLPPVGPALIGVNHSTTAEEAGGVFHVEEGHISMLYKKELEERDNPFKWVSAKVRKFFLKRELGEVDNPLKWVFAKVSKFFLRGAGFVPTRREVRETTAIDMTVQALHQGWRIMAMPEGTSRGHDGLIYAKRRGTQRIAMQVDCPVIPVAVEGGKGALWDGLRSYFFLAKKHDLVICYGLPFRFSDLGLNLENDPSGERATFELMVRIGAMLPKRLRGYYTDGVDQFLASDAPDAEFYRKLQRKEVEDGELTDSKLAV